MSRKEPSVNDVIRVGRVSAVYPKRGTATVQFPDRDGLVSKEIAIGQKNTLKNKDECFFDPGEHVVCAFYGNGLSEGVILCAVNDRKNNPLVGNKDIRLVVFENGTTLFHDRKQNIMQIMDHYGSFILFKGGDIILQSKRNIHLNPGDVPPVEVAPHIGSQFD